MVTRQQKWYAYQRILKQQRSAGASTTFSDAALAAFAKYDTLGDGLTDAEKVAMAAYIDAEVAAGNHVKKDFEVVHSLGGNNALVDYINGKVCTNVNAVTFSVAGAAFNAASSQYLDTNFVPNIDGVNYTLNDAMAHAYITSKSNVSNQRVFGVRGGTALTQIYDGNPTARYRINNASANSAVQWVGTGLNGVNVNGGNINGLVDGVATYTASASVVATPNASCYIGALRETSNPANYFTGTISLFMMGGTLPDISANNTNIVALLTSLGAI